MAKYHKSLLEEFGIIGEDKNGHRIFECEKKKKEFKHGKFVNAYKRKKINELKIKKYQFVDCFDVRKTNNFSVTPDQ